MYGVRCGRSKKIRSYRRLSREVFSLYKHWPNLKKSQLFGRKYSPTIKLLTLADTEISKTNCCEHKSLIFQTNIDDLTDIFTVCVRVVFSPPDGQTNAVASNECCIHVKHTEPTEKIMSEV